MLIARCLRVAGVGAVLAVAGCAPADNDRIYHVTGRVVEPAAEGQILIEHDEIPGFMPAMTMPFYLQDPADPVVTLLRPGDHVRFAFRVGEESSASEFQVVERAQDAPEPTPAPPTAGTNVRRLREGDPVPDFTLVDQSNRPFGTERLRGRYTILTFIFTRCPVPEFCPRIMGNFGDVQQQLLEAEGLADVQLLSITIDPEHDRPEILRDYGERFGAEAGRWTLATGTTEQVDRLRRLFGLYAEKTSGTIDHTLATALIAPDLRLLEVWRGNAWKPDEVVAAVRSAKSG